jgi:hypothetical protein
MRNVTAFATPEGRWWVVVIPELDVAGQSLRRDDVSADARDLAALRLDVRRNEINVGRVRHMRVHRNGR